MPEKKTMGARGRAAAASPRAQMSGARKAKRQGTQGSALVQEVEQGEHVRGGKHGAKNATQAIAIGLSKAHRAGVKVPKKRAPSRGNGASTSSTLMTTGNGTPGRVSKPGKRTAKTAPKRSSSSTKRSSAKRSSAKRSSTTKPKTSPKRSTRARRAALKRPSPTMSSSRAPSRQATGRRHRRGSTPRSRTRQSRASTS